MNNTLSTNLDMFVTSIKALRENMTYSEFDQMLKDITNANDMGKLEEVLDSAERIYLEGTDIHTAFHYAMFDIIHNNKDNF